MYKDINLSKVGTLRTSRLIFAVHFISYLFKAVFHDFLQLVIVTPHDTPQGFRGIFTCFYKFIILYREHTDEKEIYLHVHPELLGAENSFALTRAIVMSFHVISGLLSMNC